MANIKDIMLYIGHMAKDYYKYHDYIKTYEHGLKYVNNKKTDIKSIVFIINYAESWNSVKSIYNEAIKNKNVKVFILAVPKVIDEKIVWENTGKWANEAYDFFEQNGIDAIKANKDDNTWVDIRTFNPDYVIYTRPYNQFYPNEYKSYNVCGFAKVYYVPYAYGMLGDNSLLGVCPKNFMFTARRVFFANKSRCDECNKKYPRFGKNTIDRYTYVGFPRFDLYKDNILTNTVKEKLVLAWMPRWTTDSQKSKHKASHFLEYYKAFLNYAELNKDIFLIIRPHPLMFDNYISNGIMSKEEVERFKKRCDEADNIAIDTNKDYIGTINQADVLVADYTSLIAEFFITGKPIIYCDSMDDLNEEGIKICSASYIASSFKDVVDIINSIKFEDEAYSIRKQLIEELLPSKTGEIGRSILEIIINS